MSASEQLCIVSNVFEADFIFNEEIEDFDFFKVEGILSDQKRYGQQLSRVIRKLQYQEKTSFASYTPAPDQNYVVGYLTNEPKITNFEVDGLKVEYEGKQSLPPTGAARRTLTELLNKLKAGDLRKALWSPGRHTFYPKIGIDLNRDYKNCNLMMFRGPFFRYNTLSNNKIILSLDSTTHYIRSETFLDEIQRRKGTLDWFVKEIEMKRQSMKLQRRKFIGIHFFYDLAKMDVAIQDIDQRPISEIKLPTPITINDIECKTIAQYLQNRYKNHPWIKELDETQPGLKDWRYIYAPQFLHRTVHVGDVPSVILNAKTFLMDMRPRRFRDIHAPAKIRWKLFNNNFFKYSFQKADIGPITFKMSGPLKFQIDNHFEEPKLLTNSTTPILVNELNDALSEGLHEPPDINKIFLYSIMPSQSNERFYEILVEFAENKFGIKLPSKAIPLETELAKMKNQLQNSIRINKGAEGTFCVAIIPSDSNRHDEVTNICGELSIPSKCVTTGTATEIFRKNKEMYLKPIVASIVTRGGGIPWILHDKLHYDCYVATDIGRGKSEWWAMSIVYNRDGKFTIHPGKITIGENLDEQSIRHCINQARHYNPSSDSLIYLRDGNISVSEQRAFEEVIEGMSIPKVAMVSIKETVPYRIFRKLKKTIIKPLSGDYYFLDEYNAVLCATGVDEYEHGTPQPIVAEVIPVQGEINVKAVVEDVFKLTFLNWGSPGRRYSVPAPIRLAHRLASELSQGIRRASPPF